MKPSFRVIRTALAAALCAALAGCAHVAQEKEIEHVVVVWLKRPGNTADRQTVLDVSRGLRAIPGVEALEAGVCLPSERPIVDSSFDVALRMRFASAAAMQAYIVHPLHQQAVKEKLMPLAARVRVFDFEVSH